MGGRSRKLASSRPLLKERSPPAPKEAQGPTKVTMHTAYSVHRLLKLPLTVESLVSFDDNLLVGTRQGHLLMYSVKDIDQGHEQTNNGTRGRGKNVYPTNV